MSRKLIAITTVALALLISACGEKEAEKTEAAIPAQLAVPTTDDSNAWRAYLGSVAVQPKYQEVVTDRIIPYFLPSNSKTPDNVANTEESSPYSRQMDVVKPAIERTVTKGNLLVFGSPDSKTMGDFIVEAFAGAVPTALKDSHVLFIGKSEDAERVKAVVEAAGGAFLFEEIQ
jgi:hypothetical protein